MTDLRPWVESRVRAIIDTGHAADLAGRWPDGVPTLKASQGHTLDELEAIVRACERVEAAHQMPFVDDPRCWVGTEISDAITALSSQQRVRLDWLTAEAADCGYQVPLSRPALLRDIEVARALVALCAVPTLDATRILVGVAGKPDAREGDVIGRLTVHQARQVRAVLGTFHNDTAKASTP